MNKNLLIIGASGHGKVLADIAINMNVWSNILFIDEDENIKDCLGFEVVGNSKKVCSYKDNSDIIVAIGNWEIRKRLLEEYINQGYSITSLIHPKAIIGKDVKIGKGTVVMAGAIINPSTTIGIGCIINTGATIDHDCVIEDHVHISPNASIAGTVKIGKQSWVGIGSIVSNNINITNNVQLGAGSVVVKDISESGLYVGVPVRRI